MCKILFHKFKFVFLFFLNLSIITSVYSKKIIIGKERVGEIKIGMPYLKVNQILYNKCRNISLPAGTVKNSFAFDCKYGEGSLTLLFDSKKQLFEVQIKHQIYQTSEGVQIGSYYHEVLQKYRGFYLEKFHALPMEKLVSICIPSMGWILDFATKQLNTSKVYDSKKNQLKFKEETAFRNLLIEKITLTTPFPSCSEGE